MRIAAYLLLFISAIGCQKTTKSIHRITYDYYGSVYDQSSWTIRDIDSVLYNHKKGLYTYSDSIGKEQVSFDGDALLFNGVQCQLVKNSNYNVQGSNYRVLMFAYDDTKYIDDEGFIFFSPSKGVLIAKSLSWSTIVLYESPPNQLLIDAVLNDSKGLSPPDGYFPTPPPPPESNAQEGWTQ